MNHYLNELAEDKKKQQQKEAIKQLRTNMYNASKILRSNNPLDADQIIEYSLGILNQLMDDF